MLDNLGIYPPRETPTIEEWLIASEGSGVAQTREQSTRTFFDRFAGRCANFVSRAPFFTFCVLLVVLWAPTYFLVGNFDTYQLIINTPTTIITFLLVALLQNTQKRNEQALQHKLDAVADGLADLMEHFATDDPGRQAVKEDLAGDMEDLRAAVGLEGEM
jgi:Low affinity iron permease